MPSIAQRRKQTVEYILYTGENFEEIKLWLNGHAEYSPGKYNYLGIIGARGNYSIVSPGQYIVQLPDDTIRILHDFQFVEEYETEKVLVAEATPTI